MNNNRRVVITGVGPLSSVGIGKEESWRNILAGNTGLAHEKIHINGELWDSFFIHKIANFDINKFDLDKDLMNEMKIWKDEKEIIDIYYFLATISLALNDSRLVYSDKDKIGLVLAHENPGMNQFFLEMFNESYKLLTNKNVRKIDFLNKTYSFGARSVYDLQTFMFLYHIAKIFRIHGFSLFINNACASGLYALEVAADIIKSGKCNIVVVSAVDHPDIYKYLWFKEINMYAKDGKIKPFCKDSGGLVFGEGGSALILEDSEHAMKRDANIYAEYMGGDFCLEGWKVVFPAVKDNFYPELIQNAIRKCDLAISDIDLINPHGVGNKVFDKYEAKGITEVFGLNPNKPLITAFKPYFGHVLGGSSLLETAILSIAFEKNLIPPTLNCDNIEPVINIDLLKEAKNCRINSAIKICSAFAGFDAAIVLKKFQR